MAHGPLKAHGSWLIWPRLGGAAISHEPRARTINHQPLLIDDLMHCSIIHDKFLVLKRFKVPKFLLFLIFSFLQFLISSFLHFLVSPFLYFVVSSFLHFFFHLSIHSFPNFKVSKFRKVVHMVSEDTKIGFPDPQI